MPTDRYAMTSNQIQRGLAKGKGGRRLAGQGAFRTRYEPLIEWLSTNMPYRTSTGTLGAIGRAFLWHHEDRVRILQFAWTLKTGIFNGVNDPAHAFWLFCTRNLGRVDSIEFHGKCITAIRAYILNKELPVTESVRTCHQNIFEWDVDWRVMVRPIKNQNGIVYDCRIAPSTLTIRGHLEAFDDQIQEELLKKNESGSSNNAPNATTDQIL